MAEATERRTAGERAQFAPDAGAAAPATRGADPPAARDGVTAAARPPFWRSAAARTAASLRQAVGLEVERGTPFLLIPVALAAGALLYFALAREPGVVALASSGIALALALALAGDRPLARFLMSAALLVVIGMGLASFETRRAGTEMLGAEVTTRVTARVVALERQASGRVRLTLDLISTARPTLRHAPQRIRISARRVPDGVAAGAAVTGLARLFPPSGPLRPGGYDFSFEAYFDGIGANGFFLGDPAPAVDVPPPGLGARAAAMVENARGALAARIRERLTGVEGEIAAALIAGARAGIPEPVNEDLRRTGLAHVLSISGLHMALVAATIMTVLRLTFAFFPDFASRHPVKKAAAAVALVAAGVYLLISGSAVAAERSFLMLAVMLAAVLFDRAALTMRNLALAAIVVVAVSPHEVVGPSFQMSFAATAALIAAYGWWSGRSRGRSRGMGGGPDTPLAWRVLRLAAAAVVAIAATSLIAGLATTVYGAWHFQRVSPLSLAANLAAMPIVSTLVMPFAVLAVAAMPFGAEAPFLDVMGAGIGAMLAVARWFSERTPLDTVGVVPTPAVIAATVALVVAALATTWLRMLALPFVALAMLFLLGRDLPAVLVAEDGRLVAIRTDDGRLAVNRMRPNRFTTDDWLRAANAAALVKPQAAGRRPPDAAADPSSPARESGRPRGGVAKRAAADRAAGAGGFRCAEGACVAAIGNAVIVHAEDAVAAGRFCGTAAVIVVADPAVATGCGGRSMVMTARMLALRGSAVVSLAPSDGGPAAAARFAIGETLRPWHRHRTFSRAARGLPSRNRPAAPAAGKGRAESGTVSSGG